MKDQIITLLSFAANLKGLGLKLIRIAILVVFVWIGGLKFTHYEADGIVPFVANSPFMSFFYAKEAPEYKDYKNKEGELVPKKQGVARDQPHLCILAWPWHSHHEYWNLGVLGHLYSQNRYIWRPFGDNHDHWHSVVSCHNARMLGTGSRKWRTWISTIVRSRTAGHQGYGHLGRGRNIVVRFRPAAAGAVENA